jgi:hypothetical protein
MPALTWWKHNYRYFTELANLARLYLSISAASEERRLFSSGGKRASKIKRKINYKNDVVKEK